MKPIADRPPVTVRVRVTPRGGRDAVMGVRADGALLLRVSAAPVDGAANRACVELLSQCFGVPKSAVTLTGGAASRDKRFQIAGVSAEQAAVRAATLPQIGEPEG